MTGTVGGALGAGGLACVLAGCSLIFPFDGPEVGDAAGPDAAAPAEAGGGEGSKLTDGPAPADTDAVIKPDTSGPPQDGGMVCGLICKVGWCQMAGPTDSAKLHDIWGNSLHELWAVGEKLTLLRINPKTCVWEPWDLKKDLGSAVYGALSGVALWGVWGSSAGNVYAVGDQGTILRFNGTAWAKEPTSSKTTETLRDVGGSAGEVFAVGHGAQILRREASGVWKSWTSMVASSVSLTGFSSKVIGPTAKGTWAYYAVGTGGAFLYHDGLTSSTFLDVAGWKSGCVPAKNWQAVWTPRTPVAYKPELVLVGQAGAVLRFFRAALGASPNCAVDTLGTKVLEAVDGRHADDIWVVGASGSVYQRSSSTWTPRALPAAHSSEHLRGVWVAKTGAKLVIAVSEAKAIFYRSY